MINELSWLLTLKIDDNIPEMVIDDGTQIGHFNHITCVHKVYIGKNVETADKVYISDNLHEHERIDYPVKDQKVMFKNEVSIGDGCLIGENVCILGCKIGKNCVIGSNSVVTKDIPDYCIAVGSPAKVIKEYNLTMKKWIDIRKEGN